ncbi:Pickpocket protein 28 [Frankliniella fusca]|uniref:Pickpocket protein 28 n=1 Tax=Frankliniella fusca TaxID=407009 RepID=A0AAE1GZ85_9NEOP|nr:Pickpocket protein 28 [Frankliniella fusca]
MVNGNGVRAAGRCSGRERALPPHPPSLSSSSKLSSHSLFSVHLRSEHCEQRRQEARLTCRTICRDYCNNTAVHGFRYFFEENRSPVERGFWVCAVVLCFAVSFFLISKIWSKWERCPVIVSFADKPTPLWEVPFPAVTICPATKSKQSVFNYTQAYHRLRANMSTEKERWQVETLDVVCMTTMTWQLNSEETWANDSALEFLREVAPTLDEIVEECYWQHMPFNCSEYFKEVVSEEGVCFTFNGLSSLELYTNITLQAQYDQPSRSASGWDPETGYVQGELAAGVESFYPKRAQFNGPSSALRLVMRSYLEDMDYLCGGCEQGFRVRLHSPAEQSWSSGHVLAVPLNSSVMMLAKPHLIQTSPGLEELSPTRRSCLFAHERPLQFFRKYSQENCLYECYTNVTVRNCGCAMIGTPRVPGTPVCTPFSRCMVEQYSKGVIDTPVSLPEISSEFYSIYCCLFTIFVERFATNFLLKTLEEVCGRQRGCCPGHVLLPAEMVLNYSHWAMVRGSEDGSVMCNCLPSCTILRYDGESSVDKFPWEERQRALGELVEPNMRGGVSKSQLNVYFNSLQFVTTRRGEMYGHTDFLANFGGLLGLFTGFSVISLVEVAYYISLRLWFDIRRRAADRRRRELRRNQ